MIFVIDGGSLLNQSPRLFAEGDNAVKTVLSFFERYNDALSVKGHKAYFILRGQDMDSELPRRVPYGVFVLVFSNRAGEEEELLLEAARSATKKDETVVVTDNHLRAQRAGFHDIRSVRCSEFEMLLEKLDSTLEDNDRAGMDFGDTEYWSDVFDLPGELEIELRGPQEDEDDS